MIENADTLVTQPTRRTARKVQAAAGGAAAGSVVGLFIADWSFPYMPATFQTMEYAPEAWAIVVTGLVSWAASLNIGYYVRERLQNMIVRPGATVIIEPPQ